MSSRTDLRYEEYRTLRQHGERRVIAARDRLSGQSVIIKTDRPAMARQELRTLLAVPPGLAPRVCDALWCREAGLRIVMERLEGDTLLERAPSMTPERLALVVRGAAQALGHLHRAGFVHADIKPGNLFLVRGSTAPQVCLLDLGFAFSRSGRCLGGEEALRGGTPPFLAPEIRRGWIVDGRADQFSLGMTIRELFPALTKDAIWGPILEKLCEESPARRYAHILELRDELERRFELAPHPARIPSYGAGPMRGREGETGQIVERIKRNPSARILLCARPGIGLSRFMLEVVLAVASLDGPGARLLDLGSMRPTVDLLQLRALLEESNRTEGAILLGVPDPSPGLRWRGDMTGRWLRELQSRATWVRMTLSPLGVATTVELVAESLGSGGDLAERLARQLHEGTDGDLRCSAEGLRSCLQRYGTAEGLGWRIACASSQDVPPMRFPPAPEPTWTEIPPHLKPPLSICAHAGVSMPQRIAAGLLERFSESSHLAELLDRAYLEVAKNARVRFLTRHLWQQARSQTVPCGDEVDAWLDAHALPDPANAEEVIASCLRAHHLGQAENEAAYLAQGLEDALERRRWTDVLRLCAYPGAPPVQWTREEVHAQARKLDSILGTSWSEERILYAAARSLLATGVPLGESILQEIAQRGSSEVSEMALIVLLGRASRTTDPEPYGSYLATLERAEDAGARIPAGTLDFYRAARALSTGRSAEAAALARLALDALEGSARIEESLSHQLLAILRFADEPNQAIASMTAAIEAARDPELEAQMRHNLAAMYHQQGSPDLAALCATRGIEGLQERISHGRLIGLRVRRMCAWVDLGRTELALREAESLLNSSAVRGLATQAITVKQALGECRLFRFLTPVAIIDIAQALLDAQEKQFGELVAAAARTLIDALLDLDSGDTARQWVDIVKLDTSRSDPKTVTTAARAQALRAQLDERLSEASALLVAHRAAARRLTSIADAGRYVHHLGLVRLAQAKRSGVRADAVAAADLFAEEIGILKEPGYGYNRGRALLERSRALRAAGEPAAAAGVLDQAISLARSAECLGLLAMALRDRARASLADDRSAFAGGRADVKE
jgi:hypothetical protein